MTREDVVNFCKTIYANNPLDMNAASYFLWQYCIHRGKDPQQSKLFVAAVSQLGITNILMFAVEWCEREFNINKLMLPDGRVIKVF